MGKYSVEFYDPEPQYGGWFSYKVIAAKDKAAATKKAEKDLGGCKLRVTKVKGDIKEIESQLGERDIRHAMKGNY